MYSPARSHASTLSATCLYVCAPLPPVSVSACRLGAEQHQAANLQQHLQALQSAKGQKLAMFGAHAQLRQLVDRNRCGVR